MPGGRGAHCVLMGPPPTLCSSSHGGPVTPLFTSFVQYLLRASWGQTPFWVLREVVCKALGLVRGLVWLLRLPGHPHGFSPAWPGQVNRRWAGRVPRTPLGPESCAVEKGGVGVTSPPFLCLQLSWAGLGQHVVYACVPAGGRPGSGLVPQTRG